MQVEEKVAGLQERRRRLKASRIAPGTAPKYRTELARPQSSVRLDSESDRPGHTPRSPASFDQRNRTHLPFDRDRFEHVAYVPE